MKKTVIIGSGNLAEALARALKKSPLELVQVFGRNRNRVEEVARIGGCTGETDPERLAVAEVYLLAVSDRAIREVAEALPIPAEAVVAHTSGATPLEALPERFPRRAVFYPLQTYTRGREVDFSVIPIFLECEDTATADALREYALSLSPKVSFLSSARRREVHLAAVFVNNFSNHMYTLGERLVARSGLDFEVLKPLLLETAMKALAAGSPRDVQTGPAVRGDANTLERHAGMLAFDESLQQIYTLISNHIWETSKKI